MRASLLMIALALIVGSPRSANAHCDSLDGPVVTAARDALRTGDFTAIAIWVKPRYENALQHAFRHALAVRKLGVEARELADRYFFETAVRLHREGEGEPYTGLVAGRDRGAALIAAEHAVVTGNSNELVELIVTRLREQLRERLRTVTDRRAYRRGDVDGGRRYVATYVDYIHYVIDLYAAAGAAPIRIAEPIRHED